METYHNDGEGRPHPSTYLNGNPGWPQDHKAEDTFELPPLTMSQFLNKEDLEDAKVNAYLEGSCVPDAVEKPREAQEVSEKIAEAAFLRTLVPPVDTEYCAEFRADGSAVLVRYTSEVIDTFDTFTDAQRAASALNAAGRY